MDDRKQLLLVIRRSRRKLNIAKLLDSCVCFLACAGAAALVLEAASIWIPFYYVHRCVWILLCTAVFLGMIYAFAKRVSMLEAAQRIDTFGLQERVQTAYEQMGEESTLAAMQRQDAAEKLIKKLSAKQIRIRLCPSGRHLAAVFISLSLVCALAFVPSQARELADQRHAVQKEASEKQKELSELSDAIEKLDTNALTEEQKEKLDELQEALNRSMQELSHADSREALDAAESKLGFKYEQTGQSLEALAVEMSSKQQKAMAEAAKLAKAAAEANGQQSSNGSNSQAGSQSASNGSINGAPGADNSNSGNSDHSGNGSSGQNGDGQNSGTNGSNGNGSSNGQGNGSGDGTGSGNGSGNGRGTGSGGGTHDYVSVPNATGKDDNLTGNKTGDENGNSYRAQNGLVWEGDHVSLDSVISDYTKDAYEGLSSGRYPSGMEDVIKDYFKNLSE